MTDKARRLSLSHIVLFSLATLPISSLSVSLFVYLPPYLASHLGVSLGVIGGVWASVRLLDLFVDPALGQAMDRTITPFGRYRAWLVAGAPIIAIATYMLFLAPKGISGGYVLLWLFIFYIGNSILSLGHSAWSSTLAPQYDERSRVFGVLTATGVIMAVMTLLVPIVGPYLGLKEDQSVPAMGWLAILAAPLGVGIAVLATPERVNRDLTHRASLRDYWEMVTKPEVVRLFLSQVALTLGPGWMSAMYLFFFRHVLGYTEQQATILLLLYVLIGVAGAPLTARAASRFGKHRTLIFTTTGYSLGLCAVFLIPYGNMYAGAVVMLWCGITASGFNLMLSSMMGDVGDEVRLHQGKERMSLLYAVLSIAAKLASAFAILLSYQLLQWIGFNPAEGAHNTAAAIEGLRWSYIAGPIFFVMLGGVCVMGWRLDAAKHAGILAQLDARDAALATDEAAILASVTATSPHIVLASED